MRLVDIRIRVKLPFTIAFTLFFLLAVTGLYTMILQRCLHDNQTLLDQEIAIQQQASDIAMHMLQARRAEKDFLLRYEPEYVAKVASEIQQTVQCAEEVIRLSRQGGHPRLEVMGEQVIRAMTGYREAFVQLSSGLETIGLTTESGLRGSFRHISHQLEELLNDSALGDQRGHLDALLRWELEFVRVGGRETADRILENARLFRESVEDSPLSPVLKGRLVEGIGAFEGAFRKKLDGNVEVLQLADEPFHQAALRLEGLLDQREIPGIDTAYLRLRRAEKDYLLRQDQQYAVGVQSLVVKLQDKTNASILPAEEKEKINRLLGAYSREFEAAFVQDTENRQLTQVMRGAVHPVEPLSQEIRQQSREVASQVAAKTKAFGERAAVLLLLVSLLAVAICGVVCGGVIISITRSLRALSHFSAEVAKGNLEVTLPITGKDEIGQLATVMGGLVNTMRAIRLLSDRLVILMILISRGAIPERVEGEFHGDFKPVGEALNHMIDKLSGIRLVATRMEQLSQGVAPDKVDDQLFEGDYKKIALAMNAMIDRLGQVRS